MLKLGLILTHWLVQVIVWMESARFLAGTSAVVIVSLFLIGCGSDPAEELPRVHVSQCTEQAGITVLDSTANVRRISWSFTTDGPNCEHWNFSTWWKLRIRRSHVGGYFLDAMERVP